MMKHFRTILAAVLFLGAGVKVTAADTNIAQRLNFAIIATYEETTTNTIVHYSRTNILVTPTSTNLHPTYYSTITNHVIKTILFNAPNVVKAIAVDLDMFRGPVGSATNLSNGSLYRKVDINTGEESIVIRKTVGSTIIETNVTSFFGGPAAISNNFDTVDEIATSSQTASGIKTNLAASMNDVSFVSSNLQFSVTNCYGTSFLTTFATSRVKNLMATGAGAFFVNINTLVSSTNNPTVTTNVIVVTNYTVVTGPTNVYSVDTVVTNVNTGITNVTGPAHGTFSTTVGTIIK